MGTPFMPWQASAADIIGEVDDAGRFVHRVILLSVPRQSGKTALMNAAYVHRCLIKPAARVWHTQQTGQHARTTWRKMLNDQFRPSVWSPLATPTMAAGSETLTFTNRSQFRPHPPTADSLHGEQSDLNGIDEAWTFDDVAGADLLQAIVPTQATRPGAQTLIVSTRGTADSTWFHGLVDRAQAGGDMALIDYGVPQHVDLDALDDPELVDIVAAHHPAVGHTIDRSVLADALDLLGRAGFIRAYGNRSTRTAHSLIPGHVLDRVAWNDDRPAGLTWTYAGAVAYDRSAAAIGAAARLDDGTVLAAVVDHRPGASWVADRLAELTAEWSSPPPVVDRTGPAATVADALNAAGVASASLDSSSVSAAVMSFMDSVTGPSGDPLRLVLTDELRDSINGARLRPRGDRTFLDRAGGGDSSAFEAVLLAAHHARTSPAAPAPPMIWT